MDGGWKMNAGPRLSIGLPVYNGENYLAESLDALLGQTYEDFELIISDNASTDGTADICHRYAKQDSRIRYIRQRRNIGCAPNHNYLVGEARGEALFKWASDDDLYARDMIRLCVEALGDARCRAGPPLDGVHRQAGRRHQGVPVPAGHGLPARTGSLPEHAVRRRGR
jgi:glycosyltransferase involved in cell wall biosynthesis